MKKNICLHAATCLWILLAGVGWAMAPRPVPPVPMQFVRAASDPETGAIIIELVVPRIESVGPLARIELLIIDPCANALFGVLQVLGDRCDPVPPGAFGVVIDPASDDRSIKNVASAGQNGQWDQTAQNGILLKQSVGGITAGNFGVAFWIIPKNWEPGRHLILARAVRKKSKPEPWRNLATLDIADDGKTVISRLGVVKLVCRVVGQTAAMPLEHFGTVTLIRYEQRGQAKGMQVRRWAGDTSGQYRHVEISRRELTAADLPEGIISLQPGFYQFKHNSVSGRPPSGFYGESPFFEVASEEKPVIIKILLFPAI